MQLNITSGVDHSRQLAVLYLNGVVSATTAYKLENALQEILKALPQGSIVLDCHQLQSMNSNGLKMLLEYQLQLAGHVRISMVNLSVEIAELIQLCGLEKIIAINTAASHAY